MYRNRNLIVLITALLIPMVIGCDEEEAKLVRMAEDHLERQAEQNRRTAELQKEVAAGARQLIEADAAARQELIALQRDVQTERSEVGHQRDHLGVWPQLLGYLNRGDDVGSGGRPREEALLACDAPGDVLRVVCSNRQDVVYEGRLP